MARRKEALYLFGAKEIPAEGFGQITVDCSDVRGEIVHLDLAKVVADPKWYPRSARVQSYRHDLPFNGDEDRIRGLIQLVTKEKRLAPVTVFVGRSNKNLVSYGDGRHRAMLLFAAGYKSIPACVPNGSAADVQRLIGCATPDERIVVEMPPATTKTPINGASRPRM